MSEGVSDVVMEATEKVLGYDYLDGASRAEQITRTVQAAIDAATGAVEAERDEARAAARELGRMIRDEQESICRYKCSKLEPGDHWEECSDKRGMLTKHAPLLAAPEGGA